MICPACGHPLVTRPAGAISVDVCDGGCGGVWFDRFELHKVDEQIEPVAPELVHIARDPSVAVQRERRYSCPRCTDGVVLMRHFWSVQRAITIDECPECSGVWLDSGELETLRAEFRTEADKHAAADAEFSRLFDGALAEERAESQAELARARRFARAFRFIAPSWYIPGKQAGGAF
jgi:Zn-finger nucleic acid-binding protein